MGERGHLFVIDGDLTKVACDAWLLPTDARCNITTTWHGFIGEANLEKETSPAGSRRLKPELCIETPSPLVSRYGGETKVPVFLGHIGGLPATEIARAAIEFLRVARPGAVMRAGESHRRPLLALNHLGTGRGGQRASKGSALDTLIRELDAALAGEFSDIDVVLVAWGTVAESASQVIRRNLLEGPLGTDPRWQFDETMHERIISTARTLADTIRENRVSVFMGAGVSAGAGLKGWDALLEEIGTRTEPPTTRDELRGMHDNRDAASLLKHRLAATRPGTHLEAELRTLLTGDNRFSLQHGLLASLPCSEYITTNVDSLFELATVQGGSDRVREIPHEQVRSGDRWILKLHGSVEREGSLVFTREHYIDSFKANRALVGLVQSMLLTRHMLFVGYGLRDEDFHELVHEVRNARGNAEQRNSMGTVISLFTDRARADLWKGTVDILPMRPSPPNDSDPAGFQAAVRDLERFLDLVGMLAVDTTKFVLDPSYGAPSDTLLAEATRPLVEALNDPAKRTEDSDAWRQIRLLLRGLGADV